MRITPADGRFVLDAWSVIGWPGTYAPSLVSVSESVNSPGPGEPDHNSEFAINRAPSVAGSHPSATASLETGLKFKPTILPPAVSRATASGAPPPHVEIVCEAGVSAN